MAALQWHGTLLFAMICFGFWTPACVAEILSFTSSSIKCTVEWSGIPVRSTAKLACASLQNSHVTPPENAVDSVLSRVMELKPAEKTLTKLIATFSNLHLSLEVLSSKFKSMHLDTQLQLNHCAVQSLKSEFFSSSLFSDKSVVSFRNTKFVGVACKDVAKAFNRQLHQLEFLNCTWCPGLIAISGMKLRDFTLSSSKAMPNTVLHLNESDMSNQLLVKIDSGLQPLRLGRVRPGVLNLEGVKLLGPLGPDFLQGANLFEIKFRRCQLPEEAADRLLRNVKDVSEIQLDATNLDKLPQMPPLRTLRLKVLELLNCRLVDVNFTRLASAARLKELKLVNTSIGRLPPSWALVINGTILGELDSINLTRNAIRWLPWVPAGRRFTNSGQRFIVAVSKNPLHCSCALKWLTETDDMRMVYTNDDPTCGSPERFRGMKVAQAFLSHDPCLAQPPATDSPDTVATTGQASSSILAIVIAAILVLLLVAVLLFVGCKYKDRLCNREGRDKVKYTPASNKEEMAVNDKTTIVRNDEQPDSRPTRV